MFKIFRDREVIYLASQILFPQMKREMNAQTESYLQMQREDETLHGQKFKIQKQKLNEKKKNILS